MVYVIYCLVQSSRELSKKLVNALKIMGFTVSKFDPCLWTK
jgi:hypothetical protein